jgi:hypothetical protein
MAEWTRDTIVEATKRVASECNGPLSKSEFCQRSVANDYHTYRLFPEGGWTEIRELAGIDRHPNDKDPLTDEQLLQEFHRVVSELGDIPSWPRFASLASIGADTLRTRFNGRQGTLRRYREWLEENHPESPLLQIIQIKSKHEIVTPLSPPKVVSGAPQWTKGAGVVFGAPINFRGLRHAPTNEQGVVYLFGMVSSELGLIVEAVQSAYPDCEAKRCVDNRQNRWQRVRIEFEFCSSHFKEHCHDPTGCDMIVCWEHDWPDCPLEIIELRSVIDKLEG